MTTKTIAIYTRVSSKTPAAIKSIDNQVSECLAVAKKKYGDDIHVRIYKEQGVGGETRQKPALRSLQYDVESKAIAAVIVSSPNRIDRSATRALEAIHWFQEKYVDFVVAEDERHYMWDDARTDLKRLF
ncbi:recombinase family protein [Neobacillus fumarioli]|uniref:recombinase family protein n=1 Tax=Neobacillus fumarioli TaxID=105229 RepID=UPI00082EE002|nr:recombinase family protein [Neobacillus fumarioli]